jgi:hypothetical protein
MVHLPVTLSCERWGAGKVVRVPPDVASLFEPAPDQWGLRGDPYLWDELAAKFRGVPRPASREHLESLLVSAIRSAAGVDVTDPDATDLFIERFAHGGMSSGGISPQARRERLVPLLLSRHSST